MEKLVFVVIAGVMSLGLEGFMVDKAMTAVREHRAVYLNAVAQGCVIKKEAYGGSVAGCQEEAKAYFH